MARLATGWADGYYPSPYSLKDFCEEWDKDKNDDQFDGGMYLGIAYVACVLMLSVYFVWEDGPLHRSRRIESNYLKGLLLLMWLATLVHTVFFEVQNPRRSFWINTNSVTTICLFIMTLVLFHILNRLLIGLDHNSGFWEDVVGIRLLARPKNISPTPRAERISIEVRDILHRLERLLGWWPLSHIGLILVILGLLCVLNIVPHVPGRWVNKLVITAEVGLVIIGSARGISVLCKYRMQASYARNLILGLVDHEDAEDLAHVLSSVNVPALLEVIGTPTTAKLVQRGLEGDLLDTLSKAILIDALQKGGLAYNRARQRAVQRLLCSAYGKELTELKQLIDGSCSYLNLLRLMHDITMKSVADEIMSHLDLQAGTLRFEQGGAIGVKILSDLDDTLSSSGGLFPAGCDRSYPRGALYPGCMALYRACDRGWTSESMSCNLVFLSARPHIYKGMSEDKSYQLFQRLYSEGRLHSFPTLLPGAISRGLFAMSFYACLKANSWRPVGIRKYETFVNFVDLYREYDFVFVGDNGQGDLLAAELMATKGIRSSRSSDRKLLSRASTESSDDNVDIQSPASGSPCSPCSPRRLEPQLLASVINDVIPDGESPLTLGGINHHCDEAWRQKMAEQRIFLHRSYVGAAVALYNCDPPVFSAEQVSFVAKQAMRLFDRQRFVYPEHNWEVAERRLRDDLDQADQVLLANNAASLPRLRSSRAILVPALVRGMSFVVDRRPSNWSQVSGCFSTPRSASESDSNSEEEDSEGLLVLGKSLTA